MLQEISFPAVQEIVIPALIIVAMFAIGFVLAYGNPVKKLNNLIHA